MSNFCELLRAQSCQLNGRANNSKLLPSVKNVGVFDTSFIKLVPPERFYMPYLDYYANHKIRRYGFMEQAISTSLCKAADMVNLNMKSLKLSVAI